MTPCGVDGCGCDAPYPWPVCMMHGTLIPTPLLSRLLSAAERGTVRDYHSALRDCLDTIDSRAAGEEQAP